MSGTRPYYGFAEYLNDVETMHKKFMQSDQTPYSNDEDKKAFECNSGAVAEMIKFGREALNSWNPYTWVSSGLKAKNMFSEKFGETQVPKVPGDKSRAYLRDVMLGTIEKSLTIDTIDAIANYISIDLEAERQRTRELADTYRKIAFQSPISSLRMSGTQFGLFASIDSGTASSSAPVVESACSLYQASP